MKMRAMLGAMNPDQKHQLDLRQRMRASGLRVTGPRVQVYELLEHIGGHRAADELVDLLHARGARLSRASVFNVLHDLTRVGLIMLTDAGPGRAMYEVAEKWHHHFVCRVCGQVYDVECAIGAKPCLDPELPGTGFEVDEAQVIFRGRCPQCAGEPTTSTV